MLRKLFALTLLCTLALATAACERSESPAPATAPPPAPAAAKEDPLAAWKPAFDPAGAEYTYLLSCVGHPAIKGVAVGFAIRDKVWERSGGRLYVDYRPLSQLGGEKDVISKMKMGAVQGMLCSSVAAANVADRLGIVNLPFVVDTFENLERFRSDPELFGEFRDSALPQGIMTVDFTGYGGYGWATTTPVRSLADARDVNFRVAQAPVNTDLYKAWGLKFTVMPWPDVPQALQTGVIDGLDHTPIVCSISKKFEVAKHFTRLDYAQGLYIHLMNKRWFEQLPADLQTVLLEVIAEESARARELTRLQQEEETTAAEGVGVRFYSLAAEERSRLAELAAPVYAKWGEKVGADYLQRVRTALGH